VNQESIQPRTDTPPQTGAPAEKLIHLALPVRLTHMQNGERSVLELACTYDIHPPRRAPAQLPQCERWRFDHSRARAPQVYLPGRLDSRSQFRATAGSFTVECVRGQSNPLGRRVADSAGTVSADPPGWARNRPAMNTFRTGEQNRRRQSPIQR